MLNGVTYFMESADEALRLEIKNDHESTREQLKRCGFLEIQQRDIKIVDAGCGTGVVGRAMIDLGTEKFSSLSLHLVDASSERLKVAQQLLPKSDVVQFETHCCKLEKITIPSNTIDFTFCRFVFEYLNCKDEVMSEFIRITKPGGKVVVADLDYNSMTHYPLEASLEAQLKEIVVALQEKKLIDSYAGRKLFSLFQKEKFADVRAHIFGHNVFCGSFPDAHLKNWTAKLDRVIQASQKKEITLSFDPARFKSDFLKVLQDKNRFSYTPLIVVEGVKL